MPDAYEDFLYHNICPWCEERYDKVNHGLGCPKPMPKEQLSDRAKKILAFTELLYGEQCPVK